MSILEIYETFHNADEIKSMTVIEKELARCEQILPTLTDDDLTYAMEERIEVLKMTAESTQSDIQNEFLTPQGYLDVCKQYYKYEVENHKKAQAAGLDQDNLKLIKDRVETVKEEIVQAVAFLKGGGAQQAPAEDVPMKNEESKKPSNPESNPVVQAQSQASSARVEEGGTKKFSSSIYDSILDRRDDYKIGAQYAMQVLKNKLIAGNMLSMAEQLTHVATDYKTTNKFNKDQLAKALTPDALFGMSKEEKDEKYQVIIDKYEEQFKDLSARAKKCIEGSKQVKKPQEAHNLKEIASKYMAQMKEIKPKIAKLKEG